MNDRTYKLHQDDPRSTGGGSPPRFSGTMGVVRWIIFAGMTVFAVVMVLSYYGLMPWTESATAATQYHCPMHPTYVSNQPGDCPICGMSLVPIPRDGESPSGEEAPAPGAAMEPHARHTPPGPKAGTTPVTNQTGRYTCPMHPEVVSDQEGRCPECGMYLVPIEPAKEQGDATPGSEATKEHDHVAPGSDVSEHQGDPMPATGKEKHPDDHASHGSGTALHVQSSNVPGLVPVTLDARRIQMIGLRTGAVERRAVVTDTRVVGYVTADETRTASLNVRTTGWVERLYVDETGQSVSRGAPLLALYSQDLYSAQRDLLVALAARERANGDPVLLSARERVLDAGRDRLGLLGMADDDIAQLEATGEAKAELTLRSPFSGVVLEKTVLDGQFVTPDQRLFQIADLSTIWVLADVYERDIAFARVGGLARMSVAAYPGETFEGRIAFVYPSVSETTRTLKVRLELPNPSLRLRPGMYAEVEFIGGGPEVTAIPVEAVMDGGKTQYAFVVHDHASFEPRLITTGRRSDEWVEVLSGLDVGEEVVTSANFLIDSESRLKAAIAGMGGAEESGASGHRH